MPTLEKCVYSIIHVYAMDQNGVIIRHMSDKAETLRHHHVHGRQAYFYNMPPWQGHF